MGLKKNTGLSLLDIFYPCREDQKTHMDKKYLYIPFPFFEIKKKELCRL
jgi:hypothetical protein